MENWISRSVRQEAEIYYSGEFHKAALIKKAFFGGRQIRRIRNRHAGTLTDVTLDFDTLGGVYVKDNSVFLVAPDGWMEYLLEEAFLTESFEDLFENYSVDDVLSSLSWLLDECPVQRWDDVCADVMDKYGWVSIQNMTITVGTEQGDSNTTTITQTPDIGSAVKVVEFMRGAFSWDVLRLPASRLMTDATLNGEEYQMGLHLTFPLSSNSTIGMRFYVRF